MVCIVPPWHIGTYSSIHGHLSQLTRFIFWAYMSCPLSVQIPHTAKLLMVWCKLVCPGKIGLLCIIILIPCVKDIKIRSKTISYLK